MSGKQKWNFTTINFYFNFTFKPKMNQKATRKVFMKVSKLKIVC